MNGGNSESTIADTLIVLVEGSSIRIYDDNK